MAELSLPKADHPVAICAHCGQPMRIDPVWYRYLVALTRLINQGL
jgi:hypothetical protein